jgi:hypothetical protein
MIESRNYKTEPALQLEKKFYLAIEPSAGTSISTFWKQVNARINNSKFRFTPPTIDAAKEMILAAQEVLNRNK